MTARETELILASPPRGQKKYEQERPDDRSLKSRALCVGLAVGPEEGLAQSEAR